MIMRGEKGRSREIDQRFINQYVDDRVIAYVREDGNDLGIRVVKMGEFRKLRTKKILSL